MKPGKGEMEVRTIASRRPRPCPTLRQPSQEFIRRLSGPPDAVLILCIQSSSLSLTAGSTPSDLLFSTVLYCGRTLGVSDLLTGIICRRDGLACWDMYVNVSGIMLPLRGVKSDPKRSRSLTQGLATNDQDTRNPNGSSVANCWGRAVVRFNRPTLG
jgi:hypothetical protein